MRSRTRGSLSLLGTAAQQAYPLSCANRISYYPYQGVYTSNVYVGDKTVTVDEVTPDFWKRKKRGEIILNPYVSYRITNTSSGNTNVTHESTANACASPNIHSWYTDTGVIFAFIYPSNVGNFINSPVIGAPEIDGLRNEVYTECLAKRGSGKANLSESLAELDQSYEMLREPLVNVIKFVKDFRVHGKRKKGYKKVAAQSKDVIVFLSSEWLRFRYGISPLVSDVKAVMKALKNDIDRKKPKLITSRANGNLTRNLSTTGTFDWIPFRVSYGVSRGHQVSCRATHYDKYTPTLFNELGLTFHNVVGLAWELTRYSFVVDWFANVGDLIYANIPRVNVESKHGVLTTREIISTYYYPTGYTNIQPLTWTLSGSIADTYLMVYDQKSRVVKDENDFALVIKSDFRFDHFNRVADASALLSQWLRSISF